MATPSELYYLVDAKSNMRFRLWLRLFRVDRLHWQIARKCQIHKQMKEKHLRQQDTERIIDKGQKEENFDYISRFCG